MFEEPQARDELRERLVRAHLRFGWFGLLVFAAFGLALEGLHAWKVASYLAVGNETRRLMWTLAHAHGIGLSLVQIGFATTVALRAGSSRAVLALAGRLLNCAFVLIPTGFLLGGFASFGGDPGIGVWLVPLGAALLLAALAIVARELLREA